MRKAALRIRLSEDMFSGDTNKNQGPFVLNSPIEPVSGLTKITHRLVIPDGEYGITILADIV